jgi:predicted RNA binding protein YcfA (HicA-like mRNA interferase family)
MNVDAALDHLEADGFMGVRVVDGSALVFMSPTMPGYIVIEFSDSEREISIDEFRAQYSSARFRPALADDLV